MALVHATKRAQKISDTSPHPFRRVDVNLTNIIAIIIARPLALTMLNGNMLTLNSVVTFPFISIRNRFGLGEASDVLLQSFAIGMLDDAQAHLSAFASNSAYHGRTVIIIGAMASLLVGPPPRGISRIPVFFAFFPCILKHLICFSHGIREQGIRLEANRVRVDLLAQMVDGIISQMQFTR